MEHVALWGVTPIAILCMLARTPASSYVHDAVWSVSCTWLITLFLALCHAAKHAVPEVYNFSAGLAMNLEGVVFVWNACLMVRRLTVLQQGPAFSVTRSLELISVLGFSFQCRLCLEVFADFFVAWHHKYLVYLGFSGLFLVIWIFYTGLVTYCLMRGAWLLRREAGFFSGASRREVQWASRMLTYEVVACVVLGVTTSAMWTTIVFYRVAKWTGSHKAHAAEWKESLIILHRIDLLGSATSVAVLSGLLGQLESLCAPSSFHDMEIQARPRLNRRQSGSRQLSPVGHLSELDVRNWHAKVEELAGRGFTLNSVIDFWALLTEERPEGVMPSFSPERSTTNDVVRLAIIPLSRSGRGGRALASVWSQGRPVHPNRMVTHNWSNLFLHLVAGIVANALGHDYYEGVTECLLCGGDRLQDLRDIVERSGAGEQTYWVCAFSINQHAGICGGFGPEPDLGSAEFAEWDEKRRDTVTKEIFPLCQCGEPKYFNCDAPLCEMNKFDSMMRSLSKLVEGFSHLVVVDAAFDLFQRAWCIAEIVESDRSGIPQHMVIHSQEMLDLRYESLASINVKDCRASRVEDKHMILSKIQDISMFNTQLQCAIFGTKGLFRKWLDGQERAALIGRIVFRARLHSKHGRSGSSDWGSDEDDAENGEGGDSGGSDTDSSGSF